jgi:hypothetical protein
MEPTTLGMSVCASKNRHSNLDKGLCNKLTHESRERKCATGFECNNIFENLSDLRLNTDIGSYKQRRADQTTWFNLYIGLQRSKIAGFPHVNSKQFR